METAQSVQPTENMERIRKSSRNIIRALKIWRGFVPTAVCLIWLFMNYLPAPMQDGILPNFVIRPLPFSGCLAGLVITMIPVGIMIYILTTLIRLFRLYQDGKIFDTESVQCLQTLSKFIIALSIAGIIANSLLSTALTLHHPKGQRMLSFGIEGKDVTLLIVGYILSTIARVMQEACDLQEDRNLTI